MSGYVVGFLPIGLAGFLFIAAPGFMQPMFANPPGILGLPAGVVILIFGGFMMFIGFIVHPSNRRHRGLADEVQHPSSSRSSRPAPSCSIFVGLTGGLAASTRSRRA